jgi:aminoglycoside 6'-N-acetyltransferase
MPVAAPLSLETPRLRLRALGPADVPAFMAYRNDPEVARYQGWDGIDEAGAIAFVAAQAEVAPGTPGAWMQVAIADAATDALLGDCAIHVIDDGRQAEIGFTLARASQGRGIAREAVGALLDHAFEAWALHRVTATTDVLNGPSVALLERLGFRREGHFRRNIWFKGAWGDEFLYAVLAEEWRARRDQCPLME